MTVVLVTGASGFIGRALCGTLESQGHQVRRAIRTLSEREQRSTVAVGNVGAETDWGAALRGCNAVIHLAAHVHQTRARAGDTGGDFHRVNVEGSENIARQAARAGVRRFVFLSSVKVNGEASVDRALIETDPVMPKDHYGKSKAQAEARLRTISTETGMEVVVVRTPLVYGPGVKANFLSLLRAVDSGIPLPLSSISNLRSLVYAGNLVDALGTCLVHPAAANRTFLVSDGRDVSTPELVAAVAVSLGRKARLFRLPPSLLRLAGSMLGRTETISRLTESLQVDISRIQSELGWKPPFSMEKGLAETAAWYRSRRP